MNQEIYETLDNLSHKQIYQELDEFIIRRICQFAKTKKDAIVIAKFVLHVLPRNLSLDDRIRIALINLEFFKRNNLRVTIAPKFKISKCESDWWLHPECPIQFEISKEGQRIATFSFYVIPTQNELEIHVNNLQGVQEGYPTLEPPFLRYTKDDLKELTELLKVNWRTHIIRLIKEKFSELHPKIIGDLPKLFKFIDHNKAILMLRQYVQTYLQAGIPIENISVHNVNENYEEWARNNLRLKLGRQEGTIEQHQDRKRVKLEHKPGTRRPMP